MTNANERVLVLAPTGRDGALTCAMLEAEGVSCASAATMEELCREMSDAAGAIVIAEEALAPAALRLLVDTLDLQPPWSDMPLIVLAGGEFTASSVRPLNVLGPLRNVMIFERPVRRVIFSRTVAIALRARRRQYELRAHLEERAELLRRERMARQQAELANRMKDEFLMTISHELRTPLTAIYGWARMLVTGEIRDSQRQRAIESIERNAHAQTQLVNDLLDMARVISGKIRLEMAPVDLSEVVSAAVDSMQPAADAKAIRLDMVIDPNAGPIAGDRERLLQVVWNLLSNSIKFTPKGGRVHVRLRRLDADVDVTVSDTGVGIHPDFLPYVFDRFRQGDAGTTRQHGGLGLGLAIVRHLVELHGGSVRAESAGEGQGTTFHVVLPVTMVQQEAPATGADEGFAGTPARRPAGRLDGLRILIVDDEPQTRELFGTIVENAGGEIRSAASVRDAIDVLSTWSPDVLLLDIEMPHEDGYVLLKRVRADAAPSERPLHAIAVTAHSRPEDRLRALQAGFQWHLPKPVDPGELVALLGSLAGRAL